MGEEVKCEHDARFTRDGECLGCCVAEKVREVADAHVMTFDQLVQQEAERRSTMIAVEIPRSWVKK